MPKGSERSRAVGIGLDVILQSIGWKYETEYRFHPVRKWRFDYAYPEMKLAFEYEGIYSKKSRHTTWNGYEKDCEKYNTAAYLGWKVYRFTFNMLEEGETIDFIRTAVLMNID